MSCDVIRMDENTWRLEDQGVRFFLLAGTERALLIDSGMTVRNARVLAGELTTLPLSLLNTHADPDHTGSNGEFDEVYMHPAEEAYYRSRGGTGVLRPVREGDVLDLGGRTLEIIDLPGHTPGSIAVLDTARRVLISGDPVQDGRVFMFGAHRDLDHYIASLEHLETFRDRFDQLWPSHGSLPISPAWIGKLRDAAGRLRRGELSGRRVEVHGQSVFQYDLGFAAFLFDR